MAVKNKEEILTSIRAKFDGDTSDEAIAILEDITDTLSDYESKTADTTDWKKKYEENDASWREKYVQRFSGDDIKETQKKDVVDDSEEKTFDDLFTEREG